MIRKTWHKQLHRRKIWKTFQLSDKIWYYMKPFIDHLLYVWFQPLPVPTILNVAYSTCLLAFMLFPVIYPGAILLATYWIFQFIVERDFGIQFPHQLDFHRYVKSFFNVDPTGEYNNAVNFFFHQITVLAATFISLIDYIRLARIAIFQT